MLAIGTRAPDFTLPDADGQPVSLSGLLSQGPLILYFYPADFTPGCTREACWFRDMHRSIAEAGFELAGVSPQSPESHHAFQDKYHLPFHLLSDVTRGVVRMYEVEGPLRLGVRRATFLIDTKRTIRDRVVSDLRIGLHAAFVNRAVGSA